MKKSWILIGLFILFIAVRLQFLFTFPPYTDESYYIRFGQLMIHEPAFRFASLAYVNRQPLSFWLFGLGSIVTGHALVGARLMTFLFSIPTFFIIYRLLLDFTDETTAYTGVAILALCPLFILFQTLALMDGFLLTLACLVIWRLWHYWQRPNIRDVIIMGLALAAGMWIKSDILIVLFVASGFIVARSILQRKLFPGFIHAVIPTIIVIICFIPLLLQPDVRELLNESKTFTLSTQKLIQLPYLIWIQNIAVVMYSIAIYFTPIPFILLIIGWKNIPRKQLLFFCVWFTACVFLVIFVAQFIRVRYIIFATPALIPLLAIAGRRRHGAFITPLAIACAVFIFSPPTFFSLFPKNSPFAIEREYAFGWTSGYGIPEAIQFIDSARSETQTLNLAVVDSSGNPSDYVLAKYYFDADVRVFFVTTSSPELFKRVQPIASKVPLYLVTRNSLLPKNIYPFLESVKQFPKEDNEDTIGIYKIQF